MIKHALLVAAALSVSSSVLAATAVCAAPSAAGDGTAITGASGNFVLTTFTPKCSANVHLAYEQSATAMGVGAGSSKGKNVFGGNTAGGGVTATGTVCSNGCSATNATDTATSKLTAASSS